LFTNICAVAWPFGRRIRASQTESNSGSRCGSRCGSSRESREEGESSDAKAKTFTMKRKDGVEVKHVVTATTEIKNGDAAAKFEDIKVGDYVNGLRLKKSETEYEVVKITKIGPPPPKKEKVEEKKQ
jgi:hypothetical protein